MAAPAFGSAGTQLVGSGSTASVDVPDSVAAGDIVVVVMFIDGAATVTAQPSGFTHAADSPVAGGAPGAGQHTLNIMWKRATGADSTASTYDFTLSGSAFRTAVAFRDTDAASSGDPWDVTTSAASGGSNVASVNVSDTTTVADTLLVHASTCWAGGAWTPSTGFTEEFEDAANHIFQVSDKAQAVAGATGSVAATCATSDKQAAWLGALKPAAAGSTTIAPDGASVPVALGSPTAVVQVAAAPDGLSVPVVPGSPTLAWSGAVAPDGIAVPAVLGAPIVGAAPVAPDGVSVPVTLGSPALTWSAAVSPDGIAIPVTLGNPAGPAAPGGSMHHAVRAAATAAGAARAAATASGGSRTAPTMTGR